MSTSRLEPSATRPSSNEGLVHTLTHLVVLVALLTSSAIYEAHRITAFRTGDIWLHLRTGMWILENHSIPKVGIFSQFPDRPWIAVSWAYDLFLAIAYRLMGLRAFPAILIIFRALVASATFLLAYMRHRQFWSSVLLSGAAQYVVVNLQPLPATVSIIAFAFALNTLLEAHENGNIRQLRSLPLLFLLWANFDSRFLLGLALLAIYGVVEVVVPALRVSHWSGALKLSALWLMLSALVTLVNPYTFRIYVDAFRTLYARVMLVNFEDLSAMNFRQSPHFVLLLLLMSAFLVLGRQRSRDMFKIVSLVAATALAFRIQRDTWPAILISVVVISDALPAFAKRLVEDRNSKRTYMRIAVPTLATIVILGIAITTLPSPDSLMPRIARIFPVKACDYVVSHHLPKPIFNAYVWGGFVTWYMPDYAVAMDSRTNLYGDDLTNAYLEVASGKRRLDAEPAFAQVQTILLQTDSSMAIALMTLPALQQQFGLVYQDEVAAVFVRR